MIKNINNSSTGQLVFLSGNGLDQIWKKNNLNVMMEHMGIPIEYHGKKFILTIANGVDRCENIDMSYYHSCDNSEYVLMGSKMKTVYRNPYYGLSLLANENSNNVSTKEITRIGKTCNLTGLRFHSVSDMSYIVPEDEKEYFAITYQKVSNKKRAKCLQQISLGVRYHDLSVNGNITYFDVGIYLFKMDAVEEVKNRRLIGSPVYDEDGSLIGIISDITGRTLDIIPTQVICNMMNDYMDNINNPSGYFVAIDLPFKYHIKEDSVVITSNKKVNIANGQTFDVRKNDVLVQIDDSPVHHDNEEEDLPLVTDEYYQKDVTLLAFLKMHYRPKSMVKVHLTRKEGDHTRKYEISVSVVKMKKALIISAGPLYHPPIVPPFFNLEGLTVTTFSVEIMRLLPKMNYILDVYFYTNKVLEVNDINCLVILGCLNKKLMKNQKFQELRGKKLHPLKIPVFLTEINGKNVRRMKPGDLSSMVNQSQALNTKNHITITVSSDLLNFNKFKLS